MFHSILAFFLLILACAIIIVFYFNIRGVIGEPKLNDKTLDVVLSRFQSRVRADIDNGFHRARRDLTNTGINDETIRKLHTDLTPFEEQLNVANSSMQTLDADFKDFTKKLHEEMSTLKLSITENLLNRLDDVKSQLLEPNNDLSKNLNIIKTHILEPNTDMLNNLQSLKNKLDDLHKDPSVEFMTILNDMKSKISHESGVVDQVTALRQLTAASFTEIHDQLKTLDTKSAKLITDGTDFLIKSCANEKTHILDELKRVIDAQSEQFGSLHKDEIEKVALLQKEINDKHRELASILDKNHQDQSKEARGIKTIVNDTLNAVTSEDNLTKYEGVLVKCINLQNKDITKHIDDSMSKQNEDVTKHIDESLSKQNEDFTKHIDKSVSKQNGDVTKHIDTALSKHNEAITKHIDKSVSKQNGDVTKHIDTTLSKKNEDVIRHIDESLSKQNENVTKRINTSLSKQNEDITQHIDTSLSKQNKDVTKYINDSLSAQTNHIDDSLSKQKAPIEIISTRLKDYNDKLNEITKVSNNTINASNNDAEHNTIITRLSEVNMSLKGLPSSLEERLMSNKQLLTTNNVNAEILNPLKSHADNRGNELKSKIKSNAELMTDVNESLGKVSIVANSTLNLLNNDVLSNKISKSNITDIYEPLAKIITDLPNVDFKPLLRDIKKSVLEPINDELHDGLIKRLDSSVKNPIIEELREPMSRRIRKETQNIVTSLGGDAMMTRFGESIWSDNKTIDAKLVAPMLKRIKSAVTDPLLSELDEPLTKRMKSTLNNGVKEAMTTVNENNKNELQQLNKLLSQLPKHLTIPDSLQKDIEAIRAKQSNNSTLADINRVILLIRQHHEYQKMIDSAVEKNDKDSLETIKSISESVEETKSNITQLLGASIKKQRSASG